jgi:hypothetical protein
MYPYYPFSEQCTAILLIAVRTMSKKNQVRIVMLIPALIVAGFLFSFVRTDWINFQLMIDLKKTQAIIVNQLSHEVVVYTYIVNNKNYSGQSQGDPSKYPVANIGDKTVVYYSPSHPWLSSLQEPVFPVGGIWGIFVLTVGVLIESLIVATILNPKGRWALKTGLKEND